MKKTYLLLALVLLTLVGISCSQNRNKSVAADPADDLKVEEINGQFFYVRGDKAITTFFAQHHIDDQTRERLKINQIAYKRQSVGDPGTEDINEEAHNRLINAPNNRIARGSAFRKNGNGVIRRIYLLEEFPDGFNEVTEFLVSYNNRGNYVDSKLVSRYGGFSPITYEMANQNLILVNINEAGEGWQEAYHIRPNLEFQKTVSTNG